MSKSVPSPSITAKLSNKVKNRLDQFYFERALRNKWISDRVALSIPDTLRPLFETIHRAAYRTLGRFPDLVAPRNFNDRMYWLMLFDQDERAIACSDKVAVREYIARLVGDRYLTKLHGVHDAPSAIDWAALPDAFVIKTNHDSGTVLPVSDKASVDVAALMAQLDRALPKTYGQRHGEWVYAHIEPKILIEEHLDPGATLLPPDFKFHCIEGRVSFIQYLCGRRTSTPKEFLMDADWLPLPIHLYRPFGRLETPIDKPDNRDEMIEIAQRLAADFKYVRVDLFNIEGRIACGEMTFFPGGGTYHGYGVYQIEPFMQFSLDTHKPPVSDGRNRID